MKKNSITEIGSLLKELYNGPHYEKIALPRRKIKHKKMIEVVEEQTITDKIKVPDYTPGNIVIAIGGIIILLAIFIIWQLSIAGAIVLVVGFVLRSSRKKEQIVNSVIKVKVPKEIEVEEIEEQKYSQQKIPDKFKITSVTNVNLKFSILDVNSNKLLFFEDGNKLTEMKYPVIENPVKFINKFQEQSEDLESIPVVLDGDKAFIEVNSETNYGHSVPLRGFEKDISEFLEFTERTFSNRKNQIFNLPLFSDSAILKYLILSNEKTFNSYASGFGQLINGENGKTLDELLGSWDFQITEKIDQINDIRQYSLDKELGYEFLSLGQTSHFSSFNFYCPECNKEIMDELLGKDYSVQENQENDRTLLSRNTRCFYVPIKNKWHCPVCDQMFIKPIPVHKALDEVLLTTYDKLMEEHKIEREKRYSETRSKELEYRKELKSRIDHINFENLNQILALEDEMERMKAEITGQKEAISYINEVALNYHNLTSDLLKTIERETSDIEQSITVRAQRVEKILQDFTKNEMNSYNQKMNELSKAKRIDDERREAYLRDTVSELRNVHSAVKENTEVTKQTGEKIYGAVKENTEVTKQTGEKIYGAVKENTEVTRQGTKEIVAANRETTNQLKKTYALNAAVAKQQGHKVDDYGMFRVDKKFSHAVSGIGSTLAGHSAVEREMALNK